MNRMLEAIRESRQAAQPMRAPLPASPIPPEDSFVRAPAPSTPGAGLPAQPALVSGSAPVSGGPSTQSPKVYVFGNRQFPLSTKKSIARKADYSMTLQQQFALQKKHYPELFKKLSPEAQEANKKYGGMFGKSVVIAEDGQLVGVYGTKELEQLNAGTKLYGKSTAVGQGLKLPDGRSFEIADNRYSSPLAFDLDGNGIRTKNETVAFDIDGDGKTDRINDADEGMLMLRQGKDGRDLFGNNTDLDGDGKADGYRDGFEALRALSLRAGVIDPATGDMKLDANDLALLEKNYGLQMKKGYTGEAKTLRSFGVQEIDLSSAKTSTSENFDGRGNRLMTQQGATATIDGQQRQYADLWHLKK